MLPLGYCALATPVDAMNCAPSFSLTHLRHPQEVRWRVRSRNSLQSRAGACWYACGNPTTSLQRCGRHFPGEWNESHCRKDRRLTREKHCSRLVRMKKVFGKRCAVLHSSVIKTTYPCLSSMNAARRTAPLVQTG